MAPLARRLGAALLLAFAAGASADVVPPAELARPGRLLKLGPVKELAALNSFFNRPQDGERNLAALRAFLAKLPPDGPPVVLVTHQVTVTAFTGRGIGSGGGAMFELNGTGAPRLLGKLQSD